MGFIRVLEVKNRIFGVFALFSACSLCHTYASNLVASVLDSQCGLDLQIPHPATDPTRVLRALEPENHSKKSQKALKISYTILTAVLGTPAWM